MVIYEESFGIGGPGRGCWKTTRQRFRLANVVRASSERTPPDADKNPVCGDPTRDRSEGKCLRDGPRSYNTKT